MIEPRRKLAQEHVEKLESALAGAMRAGDLQADELARLSQLTARQRRVLWRAFTLLKQGRYDDAVLVMDRELRDRKMEPAR